MHIIEWSSLALVCLLGAMSPGPSLALIVKSSIGGGQRAGTLCALGHGLGVGLYAALVVLGLGLIITQSALLFEGIQVAGALFLLYLAWQIISASPSPQTEHTQTGHADFRSGFLIAFLNPKLAIFFLALFSQFISAEQSLTTQLILIATPGIIDALWYLLVALLVIKTPLNKMLTKYAIWIDRASAFIFALLALGVLSNLFF